MTRVKTHRPRGPSHDRLGGLCGQAFVVAFSCKGRGVCPSCNGRHTARDRHTPRGSRHPAGARPASLPRRLCAESQAQAGRHGA